MSRAAGSQYTESEVLNPPAGESGFVVRLLWAALNRHAATIGRWANCPAKDGTTNFRSIQAQLNAELQTNYPQIFWSADLCHITMLFEFLAAGGSILCQSFLTKYRRGSDVRLS